MFTPQKIKFFSQKALGGLLLLSLLLPSSVLPISALAQTEFCTPLGGRLCTNPSSAAGKSGFTTVTDTETGKTLDVYTGGDASNLRVQSDGGVIDNLSGEVIFSQESGLTQQSDTEFGGSNNLPINPGPTDNEALAFDNKVAQVLQPYLPGAGCGGGSAGGGTSGGGVMGGVMKSVLGKVLKQFEGQNLKDNLAKIKDLFKTELKNEIKGNPELTEQLRLQTEAELGATGETFEVGSYFNTSRDLTPEEQTKYFALSQKERDVIRQLPLDQKKDFLAMDDTTRSMFADDILAERVASNYSEAASTEVMREIDVAASASVDEAFKDQAVIDNTAYGNGVGPGIEAGFPAGGIDLGENVFDPGGLTEGGLTAVSGGGFFSGLIGNIGNFLSKLPFGSIASTLSGLLGGNAGAVVGAVAGVAGALSGADASLAAGAEQGATGVAMFVPVLDAAAVQKISSGFSTANAQLGGIKGLNSQQLGVQRGILSDQDKLVQKEFCLDGIAKGLMSIVIQTVKNMIIKWILTGNFEKPFFSVNIEADLKKSAENALRIFASKLTGIDFCNYFPQVPTIPNFPFNFRFGIECSLQRPFGDYIRGLEFPTQNPQYFQDRILGFFSENDPLEVELEIARRSAQEAAKAKEATRDELLAGGGFYGERNNRGEITTPGSGVKRIFEQPIESETRNRDLADEIGEAVAQIIDTVIGKVVNGGINKIFKK